MTTVAELIQSSMFDLVVAGEEQAVSATDSAQYIFKLNNLMESIIGDGVTLTWTTVADVGDDIVIMNQATTPVNVSKYCIRGLAAMMAIEIAPQYGVSVPEEVVLAAKKGEETMMRQARLGTTTKYPTTLPIGSGNYDGGFADEHFYDGNTDSTETVSS